EWVEPGDQHARAVIAPSHEPRPVPVIGVFPGQEAEARRKDEVSLEAEAQPPFILEEPSYLSCGLVQLRRKGGARGPEPEVLLRLARIAHHRVGEGPGREPQELAELAA